MNALHILILDWGKRCFGAEHMANRRLRALRLVEEAIELAQASNVDPEQLHSLIKSTYSRPVGDPYQELGGVVLTAASYAASQFSQDIDLVLLAETRRVLSKPTEHFRSRNQEKLELGFR